MCLYVWAICRNITFLRDLQFRNTGEPLSIDPNIFTHTHIFTHTYIYIYRETRASVWLFSHCFLAKKRKIQTHVNKQKLKIVEYFSTTSLLKIHKPKPRSLKKNEEKPFWHGVCSRYCQYVPYDNAFIIDSRRTHH